MFDQDKPQIATDATIFYELLTLLNYPVGRQLSELIFLWSISEKQEGITGYQIQKEFESYGISQTNAYRILKSLADDNYLIINEITEKGRAQKKYAITVEGEKKLAELKSEWIDKLDSLNNLIPASGDIKENIKQHYHNITEQLNTGRSKKDILGFFETYKLYLKVINRKSYKIMKILEDIMGNLEQNEDYSSNKLTDIVSKISSWQEIFSLVDSNQPFDFQIYQWLGGLDNIGAPFGEKKKNDK